MIRLIDRPSAVEGESVGLGGRGSVREWVCEGVGVWGCVGVCVDVCVRGGGGVCVCVGG